MARARSFEVNDIGAELFPAITRGLYRDSLDALREYVQNAIDANARKIRIVLSQDVVSIKDDGDGMTRAAADNAIRLGISDKSPFEHVGFRGIGIYSSFDLCERLEIYTKARRRQGCTRITVDFGAIRVLLDHEAVKRRSGKTSQLHLQRLLAHRVSVEDCDVPAELGPSGTLVLLVGVRGEVSSKLGSKSEVEKYLQDVVPLPFNPQFKFGQQIARRLKAEDYRLVDEMILEVDGVEHRLHQPYTDEMFQYGGEVEPAFYAVKVPGAKKKYGFAWVCFNDANKVFSTTYLRLRGLLIKKFGFSISNRQYLEPFFTKTTINRRITGELIVQSGDLIPNAARTDFEANEARTEFRRALASLVASIMQRGNKLQDEFRALELLEGAQTRLPSIHEEIASNQQDPDELLRLNAEVADLKKGLSTIPYRRVLQATRPEAYSDALASIQEAVTSIKKLLGRPRRRQRASKEYMQRAVSRRKTAATAEETRRAADRPESLLELLDGFGLGQDEPLRSVLAYIDENLLKSLLPEEDYESEMLTIRGVLEDHA